MGMVAPVAVARAEQNVARLGQHPPWDEAIDMSVTEQAHPGPWGEEEYFALGETPNRIELIDGSLLVSPSPTKRHQYIVKRLLFGLDPAAEQAGLQALQDVNLRLTSRRILIPDLVVAETDDSGLTVEAAETKLVVEVVSPSNAGTDRLLKSQLYAEAGIEWCLRVEQPDDSVELHLQQLAGDRYKEIAVASPGDSLVLVEPFPVKLEVASLLRR
jgi:Uma2 family endonuclease